MVLHINKVIPCSYGQLESITKSFWGYYEQCITLFIWKTSLYGQLESITKTFWGYYEQSITLFIWKTSYTVDWRWWALGKPNSKEEKNSNPTSEVVIIVFFSYFLSLYLECTLVWYTHFEAFPLVHDTGMMYKQYSMQVSFDALCLAILKPCRKPP